MAVPLSSMSELREILEPFLGGGGTRGNVVMVRLADEALSRLDELVEAGLFGSRSEAAAFLVGAGIRAQQPLLDRLPLGAAARRLPRVPDPAAAPTTAATPAPAGESFEELLTHYPTRQAALLPTLWIAQQIGRAHV